MKGNKRHMQLRGNNRNITKKLLRVESHNKTCNNTSDTNDKPTNVTKTAMIQAAKAFRKNQGYTSKAREDIPVGTLIYGILYPMVQKLYYNDSNRKCRLCVVETEKAINSVHAKFKPNPMFVEMFKTALRCKATYKPGERVKGVEYSFDKSMLRFTYFTVGIGKWYILISVILVAVSLLFAYLFSPIHYMVFISNTLLGILAGYFGFDYTRFCNEGFRKKSFWSPMEMTRRPDIVAVLCISIKANSYDIALVELYKEWLDCIKKLHGIGVTFGISSTLLEDVEQGLMSLTSEDRNLAIARISFLRDFILDYAESGKYPDDWDLIFE